MVKLCRQIRANGNRCASPALRGEVFCYWHFNSSRRHTATQTPPAEVSILTPRNDAREPQLLAPKPQPVLDLPPLEDRESIQLAVSMLCAALARNEIDPKRAALLLYGLQVASSNVRGLDLEPLPSRAVQDIVPGKHGEHLAA